VAVVAYAPMASVRALRGATTVDRDEAGHVADRVEALLRAVLEGNGIGTDALISVVFSATGDLRTSFPAAAARARIPELADVPLLDVAQLDVDGALPRCIRILAHAELDAPRSAVRHLFLEGAAALRPDLATGAGS